MRSESNKNFIAITCIFLLNLFFKLLFISNSSFWYDEIISVQDTLLEFGHIKHESEWDKNPPFYYYVLWIWAKFFGISEGAMRSMSAFFSSLTAVLIYIYCKRYCSVQKAILITALFTVHPFLYYYSQEARCYGLLIFLMMGNLFVVHSYVHKKSIMKAIGIGLLNFLIFYTHYIAGLILFTQFILMILLYYKNLRDILIIYLLPIALVLIRFTKKQYKVIFLSGQMSKEKNNVSFSSFDTLQIAIKQLFTNHWGLVILIVIVGIILTSIARDTRISKQEQGLQAYIICSPWICILLLYFLGKITNVFDGRYLIFTLPYMFVSLAFINSFPKVTYGLLFSLLAIELFNIRLGESKKMDYKFAAFFAKKVMQNENATVLIQTHDVVTLFTYYYDRSLFESKDRMSKEYLKSKNIYYVENLNDIKELKFEAARPILFFQTFVRPDDYSQIMQHFDSLNYFRFSTNQIEGIRFSYLKKAK